MNRARNNLQTIGRNFSCLKTQKKQYLDRLKFSYSGRNIRFKIQQLADRIEETEDGIPEM